MPLLELPLVFRSVTLYQQRLFSAVHLQEKRRSQNSGHRGVPHGNPKHLTLFQVSSLRLVQNMITNQDALDKSMRQENGIRVTSVRNLAAIRVFSFDLALVGTVPLCILKIRLLAVSANPQAVEELLLGLKK